MNVDLHLHTYHSDGTWSPQELVEHAVKLKLSHIAITDHDTVDGIEAGIEAARGRLEIIPGIEINTVHTGSDGASEDVHILGYFIDATNNRLQQLLQRQKQARLDHARKCVETIAAADIAITLQMAQRHAGRGSIGKMHLARAIIEAGGAKDASEAYDRYLARGSEFFVDRNSVTPEEAIEAITASGGIASIAHPGKGDHMFNLILKLKRAGLGAVEAYHRIHSVDRVKQYVRFASRNNLLVTGGSDCHGPFESYAATVGTIPVPAAVVEKLRARARPPILTT